jgi:hypothetical protein
VDTSQINSSLGTSLFRMLLASIEIKEYNDGFTLALILEKYK